MLGCRPESKRGGRAAFIVGSVPFGTMSGMSSRSAIALGALVVLGLAACSAAAQDRPPQAPPGRTAADPPAETGARPPEAAPQPGVIVVPTVDRSSDEAQREAARAAAKAADIDAKGDDKGQEDEGLERARAAARAADPRLIGLEKARDSARRSDPDGKNCMSAREARGAIVAKRVVTLSQALRTAREAWAGEVIDYKLCTFDGALAYDLTLLSPEGRVARVRVGASDGKLVGVR